MAKLCQIIHLFLVLIYAFIGFSAFAVFIYFKNYPAAVLGLITGTVSTFLSSLHVLFLKRKLHEWYSDQELRRMNYLGLLVFCIGSMCFAFFLVEEIGTLKGFYPVSESLLIPIIFSFITQKTAIMLWYHVHKFRRESGDSETVPCIHPEEIIVEEPVPAESCLTEADQQPRPSDSSVIES